MDLSATYRSGAPAGVTLVADAFHLVKLANRKIGDAFRRLGYRTEHPHEELGLPRPLHYMLRYNIENLAPEHLATIIGVLDADADGQQIAAVWIAKEHLRDLLALRATRTRVTPAPSAVRDKLASFYIWCADNDGVPEIKTLAKTISKWQRPVIDAVLTGYSNAKAEAHNRTAKLVARNARGFANPPQPVPPRPHGHHPRRPPGEEGRPPRPVTEGNREAGGGQGAVADGRRVQDGPPARAGSMAPRLSTETRSNQPLRVMDAARMQRLRQGGRTAAHR